MVRPPDPFVRGSKNTNRLVTFAFFEAAGQQFITSTHTIDQCYCQTQKTVNTPKNFRNVDCVVTNHNKVQDAQANHKTTNLSPLLFAVEFSHTLLALSPQHNSIPWCSQFCAFHIKILFDKNHTFKCRGKASQVCAASSLSNWTKYMICEIVALRFEILFAKWNEIISFFV